MTSPAAPATSAAARLRAGRLRRAVELGAAGALLVAWWLTLAPTAIGGPATYVVIRGDSMFPSLDGGDLVIVRSGDSYGPGDVVAYRVPAGELGEGRIVIHRIVDGDGSAGFVLLGDNNPAPDPWHPRSGDIVGAPWLRLPILGGLVALLHQPATTGALAAAVVVWVLVLRWEPRRHPVGRHTVEEPTG